MQSPGNRTRRSENKQNMRRDRWPVPREEMNSCLRPNGSTSAPSGTESQTTTLRLQDTTHEVAAMQSCASSDARMVVRRSNPQRRSTRTLLHCLQHDCRQPRNKAPLLIMTRIFTNLCREIGGLFLHVGLCSVKKLALGRHANWNMTSFLRLHLSNCW